MKKQTSARFCASLIVVLIMTLPAIAQLIDRTIAPNAANEGIALSQTQQIGAGRGAYGKLPLAFVPNAGQTDPRVRYFAQTAGASFYFTPGEAVFSLVNGKKSVALRLAFLGANPSPELTGGQLAAGKVNYLIGSNPSKWRTGLPTYGQVVYHDLWPGIDVAFRGENGELKYEFVLAPGAHPGDIRLAYRGAERLSLDRSGDLLIHTALGVVRDSRPVSYQMIDGERIPVASRYALARGTHRFALGAYDASRPLIIDPGLVYSTYLGGSGNDGANVSWITVDAAGNVYLVGTTSSTDFPTPSGNDGFFNGGFDAFVTKVNPTGSGLVYSTYLGGSDSDTARDIAVDTEGNAYVTGTTRSGDFPTTFAAFDRSFNRNVFNPSLDVDAFVTKLDRFGSSLAYSTFLGGTAVDEGFGIDVDPAGSAYVTGLTSSFNFPTILDSFDLTFNGVSDAFVTKLNAAGSALIYSTYLGGGSNDAARRIVLDAAGNAYLTGFTQSLTFPTTPDAFDTTFGDTGALVGDAFVTKLNAAGSSLGYSTFLGASAADSGVGLAVDSAGNAYVTGFTQSPDFPATSGAFDLTFNGGFADAFVTKLNATGSALAYSTYLGGSEADDGNGIAVDAAGNTFLAGSTFSTDFPITEDAFQTVLNNRDAFVTRLNAAGSTLSYSSYLGGSNSETGRDIGLDAAGAIYVAGTTSSADFPTTEAAFDPTFNGSNDVFVTKLSISQADLEVTKTASSGTAETGTNVTYTIAVTNDGPTNAENVTLTDDLPAGTTFVSNSGAGGWTCADPEVGSTGTITCTIASLANGATATFTVEAAVSCGVANGTVIDDTAMVSSTTPDPILGNNSSTASVTASNPPPTVSAAVLTSLLSPHNHNLVNVGLSAATSDGACPAPAVSSVEVFGDEDDEVPTDTNTVFSPDAKEIGIGTLRLRAERVSSEDGRVYLIVVKATDTGGAVGFGTTTVVTPKNPSPAATSSANTQAAQAKAFADANNGTPPPGYFVIGDGPVIGNKQ